jgi:hypothetical protein
MSFRKWMAVYVSLLALSPLGLAQAAEGTAPRSTGVVDQIATKNNKTMIVGDVVYNVSPNVVVHASATRTGPLSLVRVKQKIQFTTTGEGPGSRGTITEIWLP